jgi:glycosyltransferase involved in cell wall biosynthesis
MSDNIKFGIYTSFYNCEKFVDGIFNNIEQITYNNFEWHITDDFSSDNTKQTVLSRIESSPLRNKIKFIEQSEKKQMYWRPDLFFDNTFDWIVVVDSDDIIDCEFLEIYNKIIQSNKEVTLISSDFHKIYENTDNLHSISYNYKLLNLLPDILISWEKAWVCLNYLIN